MTANLQTQLNDAYLEAKKATEEVNRLKELIEEQSANLSNHLVVEELAPVNCGVLPDGRIAVVIYGKVNPTDKRVHIVNFPNLVNGYGNPRDAFPGEQLGQMSLEGAQT